MLALSAAAVSQEADEQDETSRCSDDGVENLRFGKVEFELEDERVERLLAEDSERGA